MAVETVVVRTAGGTFLEMDVPTADHALERFTQALAKGDLAIVDPATVEAVEVDGATKLVAKSGAPADPEPKAAKAKAEPKG